MYLLLVVLPISLLNVLDTNALRTFRIFNRFYSPTLLTAILLIIYSKHACFFAIRYGFISARRKERKCIYLSREEQRGHKATYNENMKRMSFCAVHTLFKQYL
jgi:hypothetical protein